MTTILFDLDGTLTDPFEGITRCHQYALERLGIAPIPSQRELARYIGPPLRRAYKTLLGPSAGPEDIERAVALFRERFSAVGIFENVLYPDIERMLAALLANGHQLFVATSKLRESAERIVDHFGLARFFVAVYGSELGGRFDDKPDLLAHLVQERRLHATTTVMVGDREHDVLAAKHNQLPSIGVTWGYGTPEELQTAGADLLCASPADLTATFAGDWHRARAPRS